MAIDIGSPVPWKINRIANNNKIWSISNDYLRVSGLYLRKAKLDKRRGRCIITGPLGRWKLDNQLTAQDEDGKELQLKLFPWGRSSD